jgi:hypothetical protein
MVNPQVKEATDIKIQDQNNVDLMIIIFWEMTPCGSYKNRHFGGDTMIIIIFTAVETSNLTMLICFFNIRGIIYFEFVPDGTMLIRHSTWQCSKGLLML